jgi:hypothetical protein
VERGSVELRVYTHLKQVVTLLPSVLLFFLPSYLPLVVFIMFILVIYFQCSEVFQNSLYFSSCSIALCSMSSYNLIEINNKITSIGTELGICSSIE